MAASTGSARPVTGAGEQRAGGDEQEGYPPPLDWNSGGTSPCAVADGERRREWQGEGAREGEQSNRGRAA